MSNVFRRARAYLTVHRRSSNRRHLAAALTLLVAVSAAPTAAVACACGCGVFDIGNPFPTQPGGAVFVEYDYMDQSKNWHGLSPAPADDNDDKIIRTSFYTAGFQYLFASGFGVMAEIPYWNRHFATDTGSAIESYDHAAIGDIRLTGFYAGLSEDNSTGVTFGIKLPSGDDSYAGFDRDTEIGTGSTDLSFGAYHVGKLSGDSSWRYFLQGRTQFAVASRGGYRPGDELNAVAGVSYDAVAVGQTVEIAPTLQLIASLRSHDSGPAANPTDSGYSRLLISPGVDVNVQNWTLHAEVDLPVYQNIIGNQLIARELIKTTILYNF